MTQSRIRIVLEPLIRRCFHLYWRFARGMTFGVRALVFDAEGRVFLVKHSYVAGLAPAGRRRRGRRDGARRHAARTRRRRATSSSTGEPVLHGIFFNRHVSRRDHVAVYIVRKFHQASKPAPNREIVDCGFFDVKSLPEGTTKGTRRRIEEAVGGVPISLDWI